MVDADKYNFLCEHYEEHSGMTKEFLLTLYAKPPPSPTELSIYDIKNKRVFLKKGVYDQDGPIRLEDLYAGGMIMVCSRKFKVVGHADAATRGHFSGNGEQVHMTVGPAAFGAVCHLLSAAAERGLSIKRLKTVPDALPDRPPVVHAELVGASAQGHMDELLKGGGLSDRVSVAPSTASTERVFESLETSAKHDSCSICIVRPHAVREGSAGLVIERLVDANFEISAMQGFSLTRPQAENFYEAYKTVVPSAQYSAMISELASGVCIVIEVRGPGDVVSSLRELCGPYDVEIAKHIRPGTIRAQLGRDNVHNAVHCTDLPEDGILESQYFFSLLPAAGA